MRTSTSQTGYLSSTEEDAKEELTNIFNSQGWFDRPSRQSHETVLNLLKEFPRLGSTRFQVLYPNNRRIRASPILLLVEGQAEIDIVRAVYELSPAVLSKDFDLIFILRRACQYRAPAAVVRYLGLKFPKALANSHYKQIALSYALRHTPGKGRSSLETIQVLLKQCPKSVHYVNNVREHGDNALGLAIKNGYDLRVISIILDVMERESCYISSFSIPKRWNFTMDSQAAKSIDLVLSRSLQRTAMLTLFECRPALWTHEGFTDLTQCLAAKKDSIYSHQLDLPNGDAGLPEKRIRDGLRNLCNGTSAVEELELDAEDTPPSLIEAALHGLDLEEEHCQSLRKLVLQGAQDLDLRSLCTFLASVSAPMVVHIISCNIHGRTRTTPISQSNKIQRLEIRDCFFSSDSLSSMLHLVTELPSLVELSWIAPTDFSEETIQSNPELLVEPLVELMRKNKIRVLEIVAYPLDEDLFYDSFLENTSLQKYRYTNKKGYAVNHVKRMFRRHNQLLAIAMEYGNVNLTDPYVGGIINHPRGHASLGVQQPKSCAVSKLEYYATLNRFGRKTARDPNETVETIVKLLCQAASSCLDPLRKFNVQYGLLRESLGIWNTATLPSAPSPPASPPTCPPTSRKRRLEADSSPPSGKAISAKVLM